MTIKKESRIKLLRLSAKMTQKQFADFIGCPKRSVENWEQGVSSCPGYVASLIECKLANEGIIKLKSN